MGVLLVLKAKFVRMGPRGGDNPHGVIFEIATLFVGSAKRSGHALDESDLINRVLRAAPGAGYIETAIATIGR